jgi:hypothetical protein
MRPPLSGSPPGKGEAHGKVGSGETGQQDNVGKTAIGRPQHQGKSTPQRNGNQSPPQWPKPPQADGFALLEKLFGPPPVPFNRRGRR